MTLIFYDADLDQLLILRMVLIWFEVSTGLKINLGKLELVLVGVVQYRVTVVCSWLQARYPSYEILGSSFGC